MNRNSKKQAHQKEIARRIKEVRIEKNYSRAFIAEEVGMSESAYAQLEQGDDSIGFEEMAKLSKLLNTSTDYLIKGENRIIEVSPSQGFIPLVRVGARAGFIDNYGDHLSFDDYDWFRIPGFNPTVDQVLFEVEGDCMAPTVFRKDIIICQPKAKNDPLKDGTLVVVVTENELYVKRYSTSKDEDYILLKADNPNAEVQVTKMKKSEIKDILIVKGKISGYLLPQVQTVSKGKIKALAEDLELLRKNTPLPEFKERELVRKRKR